MSKRRAAAKPPGERANKAGPALGLSDDLKKKSKSELIAMLLSAQSDGKPGEEGGKLASFCVRAVLILLRTGGKFLWPGN
jgi:hypothetical protein